MVFSKSILVVLGTFIKQSIPISNNNWTKNFGGIKMENIVSVGGHINASINFAMQQNYVPVIRFLTVNNESDKMLENIDLKISFEPEFAKAQLYSQR